MIDFDFVVIFKFFCRYGYNLLIGVVYYVYGDDWVEMVLFYCKELVGDVEMGIFVFGLIFMLMDMVISTLIWVKLGLL